MFSHLIRKIVPMRLPEPATRVRSEGYAWKVLPAGCELFGGDGPDWAAWDAKIVKENLQRTILRAELPGGTVFIKRCRVNTPRAWLRETVRPAKARLEFENALVLRSKGIDCIEPLAWGLRRGMFPGESIILTREHPNALLLEEAIQKPMSLGERRELTVEFARFLAKMHNAGVSHPDPHPGNFLVQTITHPKLALLDVHGVHFGRPLAWNAALANLVLVNRWFQLRGQRTDRARFWNAYAEARTGLGQAEAREVEARTLDSNREFWRTRDARYLGTNRQFRKSRHGHAIKEVVLSDPTVLLPQPGSRIVKDSASTTVAEIELDGRPAIVKRFKLKKRFAVLANAFRPSPARRSWLNGHHLLDRQIPTARPIAYRYETRFGIEAEGIVAFEKVPDACDLLEAVERGIADVEAIARLLRTMHDRDVRHRDLKATNILVSHGVPVLVDLVGVTVKGRVDVGARQLDLSRLAASFLHHPKVRHSQRWQFLRTYLAWPPAKWGDWKTWWKAISKHVDEKVERNRRTGRPLA
jgi:tRNA A-37 threonylcarbamoyl transferase component Bud32